MGICAISCTGVLYPRSVTIVSSHGMGLIADLEMIPQASLPGGNITLIATDGIEAVALTNCIIDSAFTRMTMNGWVQSIRILGDTWKWRYGDISGVYNVRRPDGTVDPETQKTVWELAGLLFDALQVPTWDVSGLPNDPNDLPFVNWQNNLVYPELAELCKSRGCTFGVDLAFGAARVWRKGVGAPLPAGWDVQSVGFGVDPGEAPDRIKAITGPVRFQSKLKLEARMTDTDGTIKSNDDVSYKPAAGWTGKDPADPLGTDADPVERALAQQDYLKLWEVVGQADGSHDVPGYGTVAGVEDILPLFDKLADDYENVAGKFYQQGAYLEGIIAVDGDGDSMTNSDENERIEVPFRLDGETGLLRSSVPLAKLDSDLKFVEADAYLVCSYHVREPNKFQYVQWGVTRTLANRGTGDLPLPHPEVTLRVVALYEDDDEPTTVTNVSSNQTTVDAALNAHIDSVQTEFQTVQAYVVQYRGIQPIPLSGACRSVRWTVDMDRGANTVASLNTECELVRERERLRAAQGDRDRVLRYSRDHETRRLTRRGTV